MNSGHLTTVVEVGPAVENDLHCPTGEGPGSSDRRRQSEDYRNQGSQNPPSRFSFTVSEDSNRGRDPSRSHSLSRSRSPPSAGSTDSSRPIARTMSPSRKLSQINNNEEQMMNNSTASIIPIDSPHHIVSFHGMSRLSISPPLLPGRQSHSAPPSPTAGSKQTHSHYTFNNTLTNIDAKLRKWISSKYGRIRNRVIFKNGEINLSQTNVSKRRRRYLADLFTTLVDIQWRFTLLIFTMSFILSWLFFATIWWGLAYLHGDLEDENLRKMTLKPAEHKPCISNFSGFTSAFLFSIETQHTIGYGYRYTTEECPFGIFTMCVQSIVGVLIQAVMVGIIFAKMSRPKKRTHTLVFSRNAVVCQRDGQLCLIFRVGDMRQKSHIISAHVRAQIIRQRVTKEGEILPYCQQELKVGVDGDQPEIFFIWPVMVVHKIDSESPLYGLTQDELSQERFEIVVILEGVIETTGATTQARSSYLPAEILWGHRFESMVSFKKDIGEYAVDHTLFNHTYEVETPVCSAQELDELRRFQDQMKKQGSNSLLAPFQHHRPSILSQYAIP